MATSFDAEAIRRILILDDDPFILQTTTFMLKQLGYQDVLAVEHAKQALDLLADDKSQSINIILCDLNMPEMDGIEFLHRLGKSNYSGGIVLVSGEDERTLSTAGSLASGYDLTYLGNIAKPLSHQKLSDMFERWHGPEQGSMVNDQEQEFSAADLLDAIHRDHFTPYFQPKVDLQSGRVMGMEALARWHHPELGMIFPDTFIPLIEKFDLIDEFTFSIARQAFEQLRKWQQQETDIKVAVNISMDSLKELDFTDRILELIADTGLDNSSIIIEVTESQFMADRLHSMNNLARLRIKRITLSIDDFGTGYSSLSQLQDLPFDELKIDRSFVQKAAEDQKALSILESGIRMGKELGMNVIAEGVETEEDWFRLLEMGCDWAQGYFIARPMPAEEVLPWIKQWQPPEPKK